MGFEHRPVSSTPSRGRIIFVGEFRFPDGDAAAIRTMSLARIFRDLAFDVSVLGKGQPRVADYCPELNGYVVEGIQYLTLKTSPTSVFRKLLSPIERAKQFVTALEALDLRDCRAVVINASASARHVPFVNAFCRRRFIPLIADVCEWYGPNQMRGGWLNPFYAIFLVVFHVFIPRLRNLIVVTKLLERRFQGQGRNVVRIASPIDVDEVPFGDFTPADRLVLVYAGMPGKKDLLKDVILALASLSPKERSRIEFRLLGPTREDLATLLGPSAYLLDSLANVVKPEGRVTRTEVINTLHGAHFSVLVRPSLRYANAGFPSKVAESLAAGTPILLNFTSDLSDYLADETAVIRIHGCSAEDIASALRKALELTPAELRHLRRSARLKAQQYFDYRRSLDAALKFVERLR